jgi:hypothetical protein
MWRRILSGDKIRRRKKMMEQKPGDVWKISIEGVA